MWISLAGYFHDRFRIVTHTCKYRIRVPQSWQYCFALWMMTTPDQEDSQVKPRIGTCERSKWDTLVLPPLFLQNCHPFRFFSSHLLSVQHHRPPLCHNPHSGLVTSPARPQPLDEHLLNVEKIWGPTYGRTSIQTPSPESTRTIRLLCFTVWPHNCKVRGNNQSQYSRYTKR